MAYELRNSPGQNIALLELLTQINNNSNERNINININTNTNEKNEQKFDINNDVHVKNKSHIELVVRTSFGKYSWCGNNYDSNKNGYYLSKTQSFFDNRNKKLMLNIGVIMDKWLFSRINEINIYDATRALVQYSQKLNSRMYLFRFSVPENLINTDLHFVFINANANANINANINANMNTIVYEIKMKVPNRVIFGDDINCAICYEEVKNDDKYVTMCGHMYCIDCIFAHLQKLNLLEKIEGKCIQFKCAHSPKPKHFSCPVCNQLVIP